MNFSEHDENQPTLLLQNMSQNLVTPNNVYYRTGSLSNRYLSIETNENRFMNQNTTDLLSCDASSRILDLDGTPQNFKND